MNTPLTLAQRIQQVKPSPTFALSARANQLKAAGQDILNLSIGEPDFDTPEPIKEAARRALRDGFTKYTATDGIPSLKQAIINKLAHENQLHYEPGHIIVSNGVKQCLYNLGQALLNPGDEVIIPAPYWPTYIDIMLLAEAKPIIIQADAAQQFKITPEQLAQAITPKTRLLLLNSPSNPTGMTYSKAELSALADVLLRHPQVLIATDDMYEHIYWGTEPFTNVVNACPDLQGRTVVLNGVSKAYAMTGWRIGYAAGPKPLIAAMCNVQSQSTSNPNSIAQVAAQAALEGDQQCVREMNQIYHERYQLMFAGLNAISGMHCLPATGAFYSFPSIQTLINQHSQFDSDSAVAEYLLNRAGVALLPGSAFGANNCLRLSFAASSKILADALLRLQTAINELPR